MRDWMAVRFSRSCEARVGLMLIFISSVEELILTFFCLLMAAFSPM